MKPVLGDAAKYVGLSLHTAHTGGPTFKVFYLVPSDNGGFGNMCIIETSPWA